MPDIDPIESLRLSMRRHLPVMLPGGGLAEGSRTAAIALDEGKLVISLLLVMRDDEGTIIDVREHAFGLGPLDAHPLARWQACIEGTLRATPAIVAALGGIEVFDDPTRVRADEFAATLGDAEQLVI